MTDPLPGLTPDADTRIRRTQRRIALRARLIQTATTLDQLDDDALDTLATALDIVDGAP